MPNLIDAKTAAKITAGVRNRTREEIKAHIINNINTAIAEGKYYIREYWSVKELEPFWYYFVSKGYKLSIAGVSDFTEAAELYLGKGFLGVTISWSDAS